MLVGLEQVQKELKLTDDQKATIKEIASKAGARGERMQGLRDLPEEERKAKMAEMRKKAEARAEETAKQINEVLKPEQRERMKQIALQLRGTSALQDKAVAEALGLSTEQKDKIAAIAKEAAKKRTDLMAGGGGAGAREEMQKIRKEADSETLGVLTGDQKEKLEKMKGDKFEFDRAAMMKAGGGGRRGGAKAKPKTE
jgi:hypothetical protein